MRGACTVDDRFVGEQAVTDESHCVVFILKGSVEQKQTNALLNTFSLQEFLADLQSF